MGVTCLNGSEGEFENGSSCGAELHPYLSMVTCLDEEGIGREPLNIYPLIVVEEQGVNYSVSSDWVVERVKIFCHMVGLSCEGFEEQMMALFSAIEASRNQNGVVSSPKFGSKLRE